MKDNRLTIHGGFPGTPKDQYYHFYILPQIIMARCNGYLRKKIYLDHTNINNISLFEEFNNLYGSNLYGSAFYTPLAILETDYFESSTQYNFFKFYGSGSFNISYKYKDQAYWNELNADGIDWEKDVTMENITPVKFKITFTSPIKSETDYFYLKEIDEK